MIEPMEKLPFDGGPFILPEALLEKIWAYMGDAECECDDSTDTRCERCSLIGELESLDSAPLPKDLEAQGKGEEGEGPLPKTVGEPSALEELTRETRLLVEAIDRDASDGWDLCQSTFDQSVRVKTALLNPGLEASSSTHGGAASAEPEQSGPDYSESKVTPTLPKPLPMGELREALDAISGQIADIIVDEARATRSKAEDAAGYIVDLVRTALGVEGSEAPAPAARGVENAQRLLSSKLWEIHSVISEACGDSDVTHYETDEEEKEHAPLQWAACKLAQFIDSFEEGSKNG